MTEQPGNEPIPSSRPSWWDLTRRMVTFGTGLMCVIVALVTHQHEVGIVACGLVLMGVLPIENWLSLRR